MNIVMSRAERMALKPTIDRFHNYMHILKNIQGVAKKTYHDKNLIFSQTDRKFKTKFSTLIRNIYAHISIKYY